MIALVFDTETSGMANFKRKWDHGTQPHLIELAAILIDTKDWSVRSKFVSLVRLPEGVTIDPGARQAHGISEEDCAKYGIEPKSAMEIFNSLACKSELLVAHNIDFDSIIMNALHHRVSKELNKNIFNYLSIRKQVCTMKAATDVMKISGNFGYKWPKLQEAYEHFTGNKDGMNWHSALADTEACAAIFEKMVEAGNIEL